MHETVDIFEAWIQWEGGVHARLDGEEAPTIPITHCRGHRGARAEAWAPEELLVGALEASLMHAFLNAAQERGIKILLYESSGMARVRREEDGSSLLIDLVLRPRLAVPDEASVQVARELFETVTPPLVRFVRTELRVTPVVEIWAKARVKDREREFASLLRSPPF